MQNVKMVGLEIHNARMWDWRAVERSIDVMSRFGMNALVFHQVDLFDYLVLPSHYFSEELMWRRWPVRFCNVDTNRAYFRKVIRKAKEKEIGVYLEVKEIWYQEGLIEIHPELRSADGTICPTNPFWFEFLERKTTELMEMLPDIAGVIVSPGTRESKITISTNDCTCERCRTTDPKVWYTDYMRAMYKPLAAHGKTLTVRDFSYTAEHQNLIIEAAKDCSPDIIIGLKNVPHDFWPTYPHNPKIGKTGGLAQWIEFDVWGQYAANGVFPVSLVEDLRKRISYEKEHGATGFWFRTDIEFLHETSVFSNFNMLNLIGAALLSRDPDMPLDDIYRHWAEYGLFNSLVPESVTGMPVVPQSADAVDKLKAFMKASWDVIEKTLYVRGHVFNYSSQFQQSLDSITSVMYKHHGREQWDPGSSERIELTPENIEAIYAEKKAALEEVKKLPGILQPETLGLPESFALALNEMLDLYVYYVRGFEVSARAYYSARVALESGETAPLHAARENASELHRFCDELTARLKDTDYTHNIYWMMDPNRLRQLQQDIESKLASVQTSR